MWPVAVAAVVEIVPPPFGPVPNTSLVLIVAVTTEFARLIEAVTVATVWPSVEVIVQVEVPVVVAPGATEAEKVVVAEVELVGVIPAGLDHE